jgi:WD40 repeat protein
MLILESGLTRPEGLAFSPDGQALLAHGNNFVQVWPRWLDKPPRKPVAIPRDLERCALTPDAQRVYVYMSGNSRTSMLSVTARKTRATIIPEGGPAWFHFDTGGGFVLSSHGDGQLTRFDYAPEHEEGFVRRWSVERHSALQPGRPIYLGSHFRFGTICATAGIFVAQEYRISTNDSVDGLVVRSIADGSVVYRKTIRRADAESLLEHAGLRLAVHPSGRYFAYPQGADVRLYPLARRVKIPKVLENADLPLPTRPISPPKRQKGKGARPAPKIAPKPPPVCNGVAFHPSGALLATVGNDGTVKLYDTATWQVVRTFAWGIGRLEAVCFTPDGTRAAAIGPGNKGRAAGGKVVVWDMDV